MLDSLPSWLSSAKVIMHYENNYGDIKEILAHYKNIELARVFSMFSPMTWNKGKKCATTFFYTVYFSVLVFLLYLCYQLTYSIVKKWKEWAEKGLSGTYFFKTWTHFEKKFTSVENFVIFGTPLRKWYFSLKL